MSDVIAAMRRTLLSCTSLVRDGIAGVAVSIWAASAPACAADLSCFEHALATFFDLNRQEVAVLATALAVLGFSVVAAILLMRTRVRAANNEARLRSELRSLQVEADRFRALLFAEPQVLVSWAAGDNRPQISGDISLLMPQDAQQSPQRILAFGTWLSPEPALQMDHAVNALREAGEGFLLNLTTSTGRSIEAMGRAIGGQAIVRIRELSGLRRELAEMTLRHKGLLEETEMLRGFAAAAPWPIWAKRAAGGLLFANAAYARATEAANVTDAVQRDLELLDSADRNDMARALNDNSAFSGRLPIVVGGERRFYDVHALKVTGGSAGIAIDASEATALRDALVRMAEAHRRTLDQLSSGVAVFDGQRRLAFYNDSYRRLWDLDRAFLDGNPDDSSVLDRLRAARKLQEQPDFRAWKAKLHEAYRAIEPAKDRWYLPDGRAISVVTTPNPEGGVTYLFDDVTESLELARQYDGLINVQRETLDNLAEAVAVFGSNGRAQLFNPAFAKMWKLSPEALQQQPHIETVEAWCRPLFDDAATWQTLREAITGIENRDRGAAQAGAQGRQRARLHDHAAAGRRHHADVPGHHRYRERRARAARAQRGAGGRRPDEGRFRAPRILRIALAADQHHRLRRSVDRSHHRPLDAEAGRISRLHHHLDQRAVRVDQQHPRSRHHRRRRDDARTRPGRYPQDHRCRRGGHSGPARDRAHPTQGRCRSRHRRLHRRREPGQAGAV